MLKAIGNFVQRHRQKLSEARAYAAAIRAARGELLERLRREVAPLDDAQVVLLINELVQRHVAPLVATWADHPEPQQPLMASRTVLARAVREMERARKKAP